MLQRHGSTLWKIVPSLWRPWWISTIQTASNAFENCTQEYPISIIQDISIPKFELENCIEESQSEKEFANTLDRHLYPLVRCPWGETEYYHKCGCMAFDSVIAKVLGTDIVPTIGLSRHTKNLDNLRGMREDYAAMELSGDLFEYLLGNKDSDWRILPSCAFTQEKGLAIMTCRDHDGGCKAHFLHLPKPPLGPFPNVRGDRLAAAVTSPRNIKPVKCGAFSNTYQMHEMRGDFNGIDTLRVARAAKFDKNTNLQQRFESYAIAGRQDVRAMVTEIDEDKPHLFPKVVGDRYVQEAAKDVPNVRAHSTSWKGSTFITFDDALKLQRLLKEECRTIIAMPSAIEANQNTHVHFKPPWPRAIVHVHPYNSHGACPASAPRFHRTSLRESQFLWTLVGIHVIIPRLWETTDASTTHVDEWNGWLLKYAASTCGLNGNKRTMPTRKRDRLFQLPSKGGDSAKLDLLLKKIKEYLAKNLLVSEPDEAAERSNSQEGSDAHELEPLSTGLHGTANNDNDTLASLQDMTDETSQDEEDAMDEDDVSEIDVDVAIQTCTLTGLFAKHKNVAVVTATESNIFGSCEDHHDIFIVLQNDKFHHSFATEQPVHYPDAVFGWEMRALVCTSKNDHPEEGTDTLNYNDKADWEGRLYCRHGTNTFPQWWVQKRSKKLSTTIAGYPVQHNGTIPAKEIREWDVAVYVRLKTRSQEAIRGQFLRSMGGQTHAVCERHNLPLIVAPFAHAGCCCYRNVASASRRNSEDGGCGKKVLYTCPIDDCISSLCAVHHKGLPSQQKAWVSKCGVRVDERDNENAQEEKEDGQETDDITESSTDSSWENETSTTEDSPLSGLEDDDYSATHSDWGKAINNEGKEDESHCSSNNDSNSNKDDDEINDFVEMSMLYGSEQDGFLVDSNRGTLTGEMAFDEDNDEDELLPTTQAGCVPLTITSSQPDYVPGHVIQNHTGTLLTRKHAKLTGTRQQRGFLQRIVATAQGQSIPLLYPEAMLFPSIFWKDAAPDQSILGAIPCSLMANDTFLRRHGLATIGEHMKNRIKNPSLLTSMDERYLCYAFDSMVNLCVRGKDTRVVLNRGIMATDDGAGVKVIDEDMRIFDTDSIDQRPVVNQLAAAMGEKKAQYFWTHTANQNEHFGVRKVKRWLDEWLVKSLLQIIEDDNLDDNDHREKRDAIIQAGLVTLLRNWIETCILFMEFIARSSLRPLGEVEHM